MSVALPTGTTVMVYHDCHGKTAARRAVAIVRRHPRRRRRHDHRQLRFTGLLVLVLTASEVVPMSSTRMTRKRTACQKRCGRTGLPSQRRTPQRFELFTNAFTKHARRVKVLFSSIPPVRYGFQNHYQTNFVALSMPH